MKNILITLTSSLFVFTACQQNATKEAVKHQQLSEEAIKIHDEIMPQIAHFDRTTVKIDSILAATKDTAVVSSLTVLKTNLELATDNMMTWMKDYAPDSTDAAYQQSELDKVKVMKKQFQDVSLESNKKLAAQK